MNGRKSSKTIQVVSWSRRSHTCWDEQLTLNIFIVHPPKAVMLSKPCIFYSGGKFSLQIGHCNRNLIHPSKHALWKTCLQGVTMYCLLASIPATPPAAPVAEASSPAATTGTSSTCMQIAQSTVLTLLSLFFPLPKSSLVRTLSNVGELGVWTRPIGRPPA